MILGRCSEPIVPRVRFFVWTSLISLLITDRGLGEDFANADSIASGELQRFQIAGFETAKHLVFVVSDLLHERNMEVANGLAPAVRRF